MIAIIKKEFLSYMHSVTGWLFMAVIVGFFGMYASVYNMAYGSPYVAYALDSILIVFFIAIPILSMKALADEKKQKTDQMLLTAPISVWKIVAGKYMAMVLIFLIPVALMSLMPIFLTIYGEVPIAESYVAILAFVMYGLAAIAVGLFISSLTENLVIAAVISFVVLFVTYMMHGISSLVSETGNIITEVLNVFDFYLHYNKMISSVSDISGSSALNIVFDITTVVYFTSVVFLMLYMATQSLQKHRYGGSVKGFSLKYILKGVYSAITNVIIIAIIIGINIIADKIPEKYTSIDITQSNLVQITEQTKETLKNLSDEVKIYVYASEENADDVIAQTLTKYENESEYIDISYIDPLLNPNFMSNYTDDEVVQNSIIVETEKRHKLISYDEMYTMELDYTTYQQSVTGYDGEGQITSAISYCVSDEMPKIYIIAGHNEYSIDSGFLTAIEKENIEHETISLMEYDAIPEDAECIIIHAPESDFSQDEANKVIEYLNNGKKAIITAEFVDTEQPNFERILSEYGLKLQKGCIADNNQGNYYQAPIFLLPDIEYTDETLGLTSEYSYVMVPFAQAINVPEEEIENITYTKLLTTSENAVLKSADKEIQTYEYEEGDVQGKFCLGVKAEKSTENTTSTVYVFSSAQLFTDQYDSYVSGNNKIIFSNIMSNIANHKVSVSIPVKEYEANWLTITARDAYLFKAVTMIVIPLLLVVVGIVIWAKRRKK